MGLLAFRFDGKGAAPGFGWVVPQGVPVELFVNVARLFCGVSCYGDFPGSLPGRST